MKQKAKNLPRPSAIILKLKKAGIKKGSDIMYRRKRVTLASDVTQGIVSKCFYAHIYNRADGSKDRILIAGPHGRLLFFVKVIKPKKPPVLIRPTHKKIDELKRKQKTFTVISAKVKKNSSVPAINYTAINRHRLLINKKNLAEFKNELKRMKKPHLHELLCEEFGEQKFTLAAYNIRIAIKMFLNATNKFTLPEICRLIEKINNTKRSS